MANSNSFPVTVGTHGGYDWLITEQYLEDLLRLCPDTVLGKYVAITSFESGYFHPTAEEIASGWEVRNGIAYSPKIQEVQNLHRGGWDEWFVFEKPADLGGMHLGVQSPLRLHSFGVEFTPL